MPRIHRTSIQWRSRAGAASIEHHDAGADVGGIPRLMTVPACAAHRFCRDRHRSRNKGHKRQQAMAGHD